MSIVYLLFIAFPSFDLFHRQIWVYLVTGIVTGAVYGVILEFPWPTKSEQKIYSTDSLSRRKLLGSIGLLAGTTGLFGSLLGPYYFWKNRNTYVDVELSLLENNQMIVAKVANKPVWILKRPPDVINLLKQENKKLRDPYSENSQQPESANNNLRSIRPEYLVVVGICTHLGCAPTYVPHGDEKFSNSEPLFFCPCHGGAFDLAGRVYNGTPPPVNMVVPAHEYVSENIVRLYFPSLEEEWSG